MQTPSRHVDVAVNLLNKTKRGLRIYRATGFMAAQMAAKDICEQMNVEAVIKQKKATNWHFSHEAFNEPLTDALKKLEVTLFNAVVDDASSAIQERFPDFPHYPHTGVHPGCNAR